MPTSTAPVRRRTDTSFLHNSLSMPDLEDDHRPGTYDVLDDSIRLDEREFRRVRRDAPFSSR